MAGGTFLSNVEVTERSAALVATEIDEALEDHRLFIGSVFERNVAANDQLELLLRVNRGVFGKCYLEVSSNTGYLRVQIYENPAIDRLANRVVVRDMNRDGAVTPPINCYENSPLIGRGRWLAGYVAGGVGAGLVLGNSAVPWRLGRGTRSPYYYYRIRTSAAAEISAQIIFVQENS